ncbi:tyrosine-type recombinase/integrase [uncultured Pseudomonas sp.]|uniref:tyrosine-type recombinase/integrase n=1 Tax=uncultured Pseudomonas sp. TaxID=114707 RepID=UPI0025D11AD5|nr:tyrosine-type recombinase/integrase [uncultured Pseudomonas sp.]
MADNIFQNKGKPTWYVRLDIPKDVRQAFGGRTVLKASLKTGLRSEAMARRLPYLAKWKTEIEDARQAKAGKGDEWRLAQHTAGLDIAARRTAAINRLYTPALPDSTPADFSWFLQLPDLIKELWEQGEAQIAERFTTYAQSYVAFLERGGSEGEAIALHQQFLEILQELEAASTAEDYLLSEKERQEAVAIVKNPALYKPRSPITKSMIEGWHKHLATQIKTQKTVDTNISRIKRISDHLNATGHALTFETIHNFLNSLSASRKTQTNYLWTGRSFWQWALKYNETFRNQFKGQPCPFDDHDLPRTGPLAPIERQAFTKEQVQELHQVAVEKKDTPLSHLIQFGAYTGARLEEIGRIRPEDTIFDASGEPIGFKIYESKTEAGIRECPLHPDLVSLFKKLSSNASNNDGFLFPGGENKYGNRLDPLSKRFGRLETALNYGKDHTFHSLRHTFTTLLHQAGVGVELISYLDGHTNASFTLSRYSKGPTLAQKREAVSLLSFDFN